MPKNQQPKGIDPKPATTPNLHTESFPGGFTPTQEQIDDLARRMMPEIKRFFADEQIQREFEEWLAKQGTK